MRYGKLTDQQERESTFFQTTELLKADRYDRQCLNNVVGGLWEALGLPRADWGATFNKGSVTFQHDPEPSQPITVFIDVDNKLARQYQLQIAPNPVVLAADLVQLSPVHRHCVREELRRLFRDHYIDPENRQPHWGSILKRHFNPGDYHFDIAFFDCGPCPEDVMPAESTLLKVGQLMERSLAGERVVVERQCGTPKDEG